MPAAPEARSSLDVLSAREREILRLLADGQHVAVTAARLCLSPSAVQTHVRIILRKLGVRSQLEGVAIAFKDRSVIASAEAEALLQSA